MPPVLPLSECDVAIIGGGINGACLYCDLTAGGYRVLLIDRGDFASGTSQASTMMIWGGLLYLKDWELGTVCSLSASRDRLIARQPAQIRPRTVRYVPVPGGRSRAFVQSVLYAYWLLGGARRMRPRFERDFDERALLNHGGVAGALTYQEGGLEASDARFVLSWILHGGGSGSAARNYCALESTGYDRSRREWRLDLGDTLGGGSCHVRARLVVNAAGGWTDQINLAAGIESPHRHVLSRGVSIAVPRDPSHTAHLAFDKGGDGSAMTFVPWGPVALWGSTDTVHADMERAQQADTADLRFLLNQLNRHLAKPAGPGDVVSLRCGVRPVAVPRNQKIDEHSPSLSRHHRVHADQDLPWISVYGGKLSGCTTLSRAVCARVAGVLGPSPMGPRRTTPDPPSDDSDVPTERFPGLDTPVVSAAWSAAHESCRTLDDYLRRRTNIAQWVRRGGMGAHHEHVGHLRAIAVTLHGGDQAKATKDLHDYRARLDREWHVLEGVSR